MCYIVAMQIITSSDNPRVKYYASLHDRKTARKEGVVFLEGTRLCEDALSSGAIPAAAVSTEDMYGRVSSLCAGFCSVDVVSDSCFSKIASTVNPQGMAIVVKTPPRYRDIPFRGDGNDIYAVLENVQDPGNLGTIIRMADAFDFTAVIITSGTCDPYNEKVLRASMGSVWHIPLIAVRSMEEVFSFCKINNITTYAMHLKGDELKTGSLVLPAAYMIGNEGNGLSDYAASGCSCLLKIPMPGRAESLNAASAASIIGFCLSSSRK